MANFIIIKNYLLLAIFLIFSSLFCDAQKKEDCNWPLSPNFDINIGSDKSEFQVPQGWLVSGQTYYWRVKARDDHGNWGKYSEIWEFRTEF